MATEIEGRILNINEIEITKKLAKSGAKQLGNYNFRRYVFNTIPKVPNRWVRLRTNGEKTTLAVKEISEKRGLDSTSEWEIEVSDFDTTYTLLKKIGLKPKGYQENRRAEYSLNGAIVSIDTWPILGTHLEIEAKSELQVHKCAETLGFSAKDIVDTDVDNLYKKIGINLEKISKLTFESGAE